MDSRTSSHIVARRERARDEKEQSRGEGGVLFVARLAVVLLDAVRDDAKHHLVRHQRACLHGVLGLRRCSCARRCARARAQIVCRPRYSSVWRADAELPVHHTRKIAPRWACRALRPIGVLARTAARSMSPVGSDGMPSSASIFCLRGAQNASSCVRRPPRSAF